MKEKEIVMIRIGIHVAAWPYTFDKGLAECFHRAKTLGFDGIELVLPRPSATNMSLAEELGSMLTNEGLGCTGSVALRQNENLIDDNQEVRERGGAYLRHWIDMCAALNCTILAGPIAGAFEMYKGRGRNQEEWCRAVTELRGIADYAKRSNIVLGVEVVNRYETYFINTASDAVQLIKEVDRDNVKILLDTYHMNIEETDFYTPIKKCGQFLGHFHACENDRGAPGTGHIDWDGVFRALSEIHYEGWLVIETFYGHSRNSPIATSIWRRLADDPDEIPRKGLQFLRTKLRQHASINQEVMLKSAPPR